LLLLLEVLMVYLHLADVATGPQVDFITGWAMLVWLQSASHM
jgi:hypothetical protein